MPDFKPGDVVTVKYPERWPHTIRDHGYLWVVDRVTRSGGFGVLVRSVATGSTGAFQPEEIIGADDA
jgi:hypothetical protein